MRNDRLHALFLRMELCWQRLSEQLDARVPVVAARMTRFQEDLRIV